MARIMEIFKVKTSNRNNSMTIQIKKLKAYRATIMMEIFKMKSKYKMMKTIKLIHIILILRKTMKHKKCMIQMNFSN
jgi:hypothetical protein